MNTANCVPCGTTIIVKKRFLLRLPQIPRLPTLPQISFTLPDLPEWLLRLLYVMPPRFPFIPIRIQFPRIRVPIRLALSLLWLFSLRLPIPKITIPSIACLLALILKQILLRLLTVIPIITIMLATIAAIVGLITTTVSTLSGLIASILAGIAAALAPALLLFALFQKQIAAIRAIIQQLICFFRRMLNLNFTVPLDFLDRIMAIIQVIVSIIQIVAGFLSILGIPRFSFPNISLSISLPKLSLRQLMQLILSIIMKMLKILLAALLALLINFILSIPLPDLSFSKTLVYYIDNKRYVDTVAAFCYKRDEIGLIKFPKIADMDKIPIQDGFKQVYKEEIRKICELGRAVEETMGAMADPKLFVFSTLFDTSQGCVCEEYKRLFVDNQNDYDENIFVFAFEKTYDEIYNIFKIPRDSDNDGQPDRMPQQTDSNGIPIIEQEDDIIYDNWLEDNVILPNNFDKSQKYVLFYYIGNQCDKFFARNWDWSDTNWMLDYRINDRKALVVLAHNGKIEAYSLYAIWLIMEKLIARQ